MKEDNSRKFPKHPREFCYKLTSIFTIIAPPVHEVLAGKKYRPPDLIQPPHSPRDLDSINGASVLSDFERP